MTELALLPGGRHGSAAGVNDEGVVVGVSDTGEDTRHAVLWREGRVTDLGTLGGRSSEAADVNRHGVVVGSSDTSWGDHHVFVWKNGLMTRLRTLGGDQAFAAAVNDRGWVVGQSATARRQGPFRAYLWKAGRMTDLGTLVPGAYQSSCAYDIDNRGRIVGDATVDNMNAVPVMWEDGVIRRLPDRCGRATAINSRGQVAGALSTGSESFVWSRDQLTVIGPVDGAMYVEADGIDRRGRVLGHADSRSFIWHRGKFEWFPGHTTGWSSAKAISDNGRFVCGSTSTPDGLTSHPVVWVQQ
jgi:probable HAF family extracellular repeat protein